jgi:hypothetical protein
MSIDDNEMPRLRLLADDIFGADHLLGVFCWKTRNTDNRVKTYLSVDHEYVLAYSGGTGVLRGRKIDRSDFDNPDGDPRGPYVTDPLTGKATGAERPNLHYTIENPSTGDSYEPDPARGWITDRQGFKELLNENRIWWPPDPSKGKPRKKRFLSQTDERMPVSSFWADVKGQSGADEVDRILGERMFAFPKAVDFMQRLLEVVADRNAIILDSFAGSGTTAHALLQLNRQDGGNRRFILIECDDYADSITAERVRRVIKGVPTAKDDNLKKGLGGSFSYFELGKSIELESILDGDDLPSYKELARYVFYTATGEEFDEKKVVQKKNFIGESRNYQVYLFYVPKVEVLKGMAFTLDNAKALPRLKEGKRRLVFAPTKYLDQDHLDRYRIDFAQLPFEIYELTR